MGVAISAVQTLESGAGVYAFSGPVACTTSAKSVILQQDSNYRDCLYEFTFSGSIDAADLAASSRSNFAIILNDITILNLKINGSTGGSVNLSPMNATVSVFVPRNSAIRVDVTDGDTTGSTTTMLRGYYLEPPVKQQD